MTERDFEYLLSTLSDARSRAAEITVAVNSRIGGGHRLSELGNSAVSQIENLLREIRRVAADKSETSVADGVRAPSRVEPTKPARQPDKPDVLFAAAPPSASQHWFHEFINEVLELFLSSSDISFETVERTLAKHKEAFEKELEVSRRMYRTYPHLFKEI